MVRGTVAILMALDGRLLSGLPIVLFSLLSASCGEQANEADQPRVVDFEFTELTWSSVDVSPDGQSVLFDALGNLYLVPLAGGQVRVLRDEPSWDMMARFSPDGQSIVFASDAAGGNMDLWVMPAEGGAARHLWADASEVLYPEWSADGTAIYAVGQTMPPAPTDRGLAQSEGLVTYDVASGKVTPPSGNEDSKTWQYGDFPSTEQSGRYLYFYNPVVPGSRIHRQDHTRKRIEPLEIPSAQGEWTFAPRVSPDGRYLAYLVAQSGNTTLRLLDMANGGTRDLFAWVTELGHPARLTVPGYGFTPDGREVVIATMGEIRRIDVNSGAITPVSFRARFSREMPSPPRTARALPDGPVKATQIRFPSVSPDESLVAFSALGRLWLHDRVSGETRRVTDDEGWAFAPVFSPDGRELAYVVWRDDGEGRVMRVSVQPGTEPEPVTCDGGYYMNPAWSPDGSRVAYLRGDDVASGTGSPVSRVDLEWLDVGACDVHTVVRDVGGTWGKDRRHTPLAFSPDGRRIYYAAMGTYDRKGVAGGSNPGLHSIDLEGRQPRLHFLMGGFLACDHFVISPSGGNVAISANGWLWAASLSRLESAGNKQELVTADVLDAMPGALITKHRPSYVTWTGDDSMIWSVANGLYSSRLDGSGKEVFATIELEAPRAVPEGVIAYVNARIVTMAGDGIIEYGTVLVRGDRIAAVGQADEVRIPPDAKVLDVSGHTIVPGLIDSHAHPHLQAREYFWEQRTEYLSNLAYGVTTALEAAAEPADVLDQAALVATGEMIGPRVLSVARAVLGVNIVIETSEDARRIVGDLQAHGAWVVKSYMLPRRDQREWLVEAAREAGLGVITHYYAHQPWGSMIATAEGHTAIEHMMQVPPEHQDWVQYFAASGTHITPTLFADQVNRRMPFVVADHYDADLRLQQFTPRYSYERSMRFARKLTDIGLEVKYSWFEWMINGFASVLRAGGHVSMGAHGELHGMDAHMEMWTLVMNGFTPLEALSTYTTESAHKLGIENELGSLQEGYYADFLVLNSNPLDDIRKSADIEYVVKNGFLYHSKTLTQLYPEYVLPPRLVDHTDEDWDALMQAAPGPLH